MQGACTRGFDCKYAHGDKDIEMQLDPSDQHQNLHDKTVVFSEDQDYQDCKMFSCEVHFGCFCLFSALFHYVHHIAPCAHIVLLPDSLHDP